MTLTIIETIGHSPFALAVVIITLSLAVVREVTRASNSEEAVRLAHRLSLPLLVLALLFAVLIGVRMALILS